MRLMIMQYEYYALSAFKAIDGHYVGGHAGFTHSLIDPHNGINFFEILLYTGMALCRDVE